MQKTLAILMVLSGLAAAGCGQGGSLTLEQFFNQYRSGQIVEADHGVLFYGCDKVVRPGTPVVVEACLRSPRSFLGIKGATIEFLGDDGVIGRAVTDEEGSAKIVWTAALPGSYEIEIYPVRLPADLDEDYIEAGAARSQLLVEVCPPQTKFIVLDLDHTLVDDTWVNVLTRDDARAMASSVEVLRRIAERYQVIYLTHRPEVLTARSKQWLRESDFPPGVLLSSEMRQTVEGNAKFKSAHLAALRKDFPGVEIGVGDLASDARAYLENGMTAYLIPRLGPSPRDLLALAAKIRSLPAQERLQVVSNWSQIEQGVLHGGRFTAEAFARKLEATAAARK